MKPLDHITVLDLTRLLPGAVATMWLGDFGANVIKIEDKKSGDPARHMPPFINGEAAIFLATNRNKKSITLDLKNPDDKESFLKLAATADVLVEGFRPGVMRRLGFDYETLKILNPRLVYCSISGYGQDGPYREIGGHDINYMAISGALGLNGLAGDRPAIPGVQIADLAGGSMQSVMGILLALMARAKSGAGQFVDVSMMDGAFNMMQVPLSIFFATGHSPQSGNETLSGKLACYNIYETLDGRHLSLGALELKFWENACRVIGREDFISLHRGDDVEQEKCIAEVREIFKSKTAQEWLELFSKTDACLMLINNVEEAVNDPQVQLRKLVIEIDHPKAGKIKQIANPVKLSETPAETFLPPPGLGQHNEEVVGGR
jgi:crotonobetainyl-CoA:carnitine CoA-transferase CaiB-like acyl-CoA transferase